MKPLRVIAGLAIAGGVTIGAMGATGVGVAFADWPPPPPGPGGPGPDHHDWGPPPPPPPWGGPGPANWGPPPPPPNGTWNGGWEPDGGFCLFGACV